MKLKTIIISLLLVPVTGMADSTVFETMTATFPGSGKPGMGQSPVNIYWITNINSTKQFNESVSKVDIGKCNIVLINAGYTYHSAPSPVDENRVVIDSEYTLGSRDEPLVLNGNGYSEYAPPYNGFYNQPASGDLYDITRHVFFKIGVGHYNNIILNNAAASTGNSFFSSHVNTSVPASISGVTLNNSFFYVNQLGDYNTFTANGHSTVAVVGTYLTHFYTSVPSRHFTQYSGTEYTFPYQGGKYGQDSFFTVRIKDASYNDTSEEILRGNSGKILTFNKNGDGKYMPLTVTAESYNSVFRNASGQRVMMMAVAHSPSFYDNAWLKVENDGEVADAVLNQHATATISPGATMTGVTRLNDNAQIMFGAYAPRPVQVDDLRMNTAETLATV
ncbi:TPA: hypothetical protein ACIVZW_004969, partial [Salmonella enterica subsp. enterica serovar Oranienburg]